MPPTQGPYQTCRITTEHRLSLGNSCVAFDMILRISGAIALWAIEIIMQLRIYALFGCSRKVYFFKWSHVRHLEVHAIDCDHQCHSVFRFHGIISWDYDIHWITKEQADSYRNTPSPTRMSRHKRRHSMDGMDSGYVKRTISLRSCGIYRITATIYEAILFGFALFKYIQGYQKSVPGIKLVNTLINDNILYFFG